MDRYAKRRDSKHWINRDIKTKMRTSKCFLPEAYAEQLSRETCARELWLSLKASSLSLTTGKLEPQVRSSKMGYIPFDCPGEPDLRGAQYVIFLTCHSPSDCIQSEIREFTSTGFLSNAAICASFKTVFILRLFSLSRSGRRCSAVDTV